MPAIPRAATIGRDFMHYYTTLFIFFLSSDVFLDALCSVSFYSIRELTEKPYLAHASPYIIIRFPKQLVGIAKAEAESDLMNVKVL